MIRFPQGRLATTLRAAAPLALLAAAATVLLRFPPTRSAFYPQCPIYAALHLACPGCGGTRALASLLHGHLREALHFNALITLMIPFALSYGIACYRRLLRDKDFRWPELPHATIYAVTTSTVLFAILRNLSLR
jgi:Protein of unknown function (DUF2752)